MKWTFYFCYKSFLTDTGNNSFCWLLSAFIFNVLYLQVVVVSCIILYLFAETVPIRTVNRQCSSGLQAVADVAACIKAGFYDIGKKKITF